MYDVAVLKTPEECHLVMRRAREGMFQSLVEWTRGRVETNGFTLLVEKGLPEYTGEYLVARYAERFPQDVVALAHERLRKHDIPLPP